MVPDPIPEPPASIIQGNVRGLSSYDRTKVLSLGRYAEIYNSIVIALTETHLSEDIEDNEIDIKGWSLFRSDRKSRKCGGTILYVKEGIPVTEESGFSNSYCEIIATFYLVRILLWCPFIDLQAALQRNLWRL